MTRLAIADTATGRIFGFVQCHPSEAHLQGDETQTAVPTTEDTREALHYVTGDPPAVVPRPTPPAPPSLVADVAATWAGLQPGTTVRVIDPDSGVEAGSDDADMNGGISLTLPAGPWRLIVEERFPATARTFEIEVGE